MKPSPDSPSRNLFSGLRQLRHMNPLEDTAPSGKAGHLSPPRETKKFVSGRFSSPLVPIELARRRDWVIVWEGLFMEDRRCSWQEAYLNLFQAAKLTVMNFKTLHYCAIRNLEPKSAGFFFIIIIFFCYCCAKQIKMLWVNHTRDDEFSQNNFNSSDSSLVQVEPVANNLDLVRKKLNTFQFHSVSYHCLCLSFMTFSNLAVLKPSEGCEWDIWGRLFSPNTFKVCCRLSKTNVCCTDVRHKTVGGRFGVTADATTISLSICIHIWSLLCFVLLHSLPSSPLIFVNHLAKLICHQYL